MKHKLWLIQIPFVAVFTFAFWVVEAGYDGSLNNEFLRESLAPALRSVAGMMTNVKFQMRGPQAPKNKVVIVEIDNDAIATIGRWPWHRDATAFLVDKVVQAGAKVVGLDIVFSEPDQRIPDDLAAVLKEKQMGPLIDSFETDFALQKVVQTYNDKLVLGWMIDQACQPLYNQASCMVTGKEYTEKLPQNFEKFAYEELKTPASTPFDITKTMLLANTDVIVNTPLFANEAKHAGYLNCWPDKDSYIRRANLLTAMDKKVYPSIALAMAKVGMGEQLSASVNESGKLSELRFSNSGRQIPVSPTGWMDINFRGPSYTFQYIRALEVMKEEDEISIQSGRTIAAASKKDLLKDAYVLIGLSALGVFDMRAFPYDSNTPGVEGHANILDNLLSGDMLVHRLTPWDAWMILFLMVAMALAFAYAAERFESIPGLVIFVVLLGGTALIDFKVLFMKNNVNWNLSFFYIEILSIFMVTTAIKYVLEERNKKFITGAFAKYVSPAIIDSIMADPTKLTVGGEKRELSIMFSDIRSFTTFSEKMDAKMLAQFLNEYLGVMTDLVFANQGTLDKYIGDAVMAFWGAPLDQPCHASNACKAAILMQQKLLTLRPELKAKYDVEVNVGIGVNSGDVNVGNMGSSTIFEYTVIGDQVNLASRLEGLTKPYGTSILTTRFTFDSIKASGETYPEHRVIDFVKVKGKKKAVEIIQIFEREYPKDGLAIFEEGRVLYTQQKWDDAISKFEAANKVISASLQMNDEPSTMYIERCKEFKQTPPAADWDGSWEMHSK